MAPKRGQRKSRPTPYDPELYENWTIARLKAELSRRNISFSSGEKRMALVRKIKSAMTQAAPRGAVSHDTPEPTHNASLQDGRQTGNELQSRMLETITTLAESVSTLQDAYTRIEQKLSNVTMDRRPSSSQPASFERNMDLPVPSGSIDLTVSRDRHEHSRQESAEEYSLDSAYRQMNADSINNTAGEIAKRSRFGYVSESLPLVETVSPAIRKQIITGRDVNLAALLIPYYNGQSDMNNCSPDKQDARLSRTLTLNEFILAFGVYKQVMCTVHPHRRVELDLYERDIVDMGTKYNSGFYEYHRQFSLRAASHLLYNNKKIDWSVRDNTLFCNIFANQMPIACGMCGSTLHTTNFCPSSAQDRKQQSTYGQPSSHQKNTKSSTTTDSKGRPRVLHDGKEICNNFNGNFGCSSNFCQFSHVCLVCKENHSKYICPLESRQGQKKKK